MEKLSLKFALYILCISLVIRCKGNISSTCLKEHVALFIFGDSILDVGNNNYINTTIRSNYYPYGETFFKYPTGRFSDGRLIPDFLGKSYASFKLIPKLATCLNFMITNSLTVLFSRVCEFAVSSTIFTAPQLSDCIWSEFCFCRSWSFG